MPQIKLKTLTFRNFMSYGNNLNRVDFIDGLIWCYADNGFGKSTIVESLCFGLFGVSYRGGNKGDLRNTRNPDGELEVSVVFDIRQTTADEWEAYRIFRTMSPSGKIKFDVEKQEDGKWVPQNKRAGYVQKDFEDNILGFNLIVFKYVIAMNTQETPPFLDLGAAKRREFTESIIALPLDGIKKSNAKRTSAASLELDLANAEYVRLGTEIENTKAIIEKMKEERKQSIDALVAEQDSIKGQIDDCNARAQALQPELDSISGNISELDRVIATIPQLRNRLSVLNQASQSMAVIDGYNAELDSAKGALAEIESRISSFDVETHRNAISSLNSEISAHESRLRAIDREIYGHNMNLSNATKKMDELVNAANNMKVGVPCPTCGQLSTEASIEPHKNELRRQYKEVKKAANGIQSMMSQLTDEQAGLNDKITKLTDEVNVHNTAVSTYAEFERNELLPARTRVSTASQNVEKCRADLERAGVDVNAIRGEIDSVNGQLADIETKRSEREELNRKYMSVDAERTGILGPVIVLQGRYRQLSSEIARLKTNLSDDSLGLAERRLTDATTEREHAQERMQKASDDKLLCNTIAEMCSDGGMKKMIFDIFIPKFNAAVQKNLIHANLPFSITFDATMDYTFHSDPGYAPNYDMLSQGQKRKVGFAISLAFRDFVSLIGNFQVNFLSLDEVLDISTDNNAMREMLELIKGMVDEIGCAMVITHRGSVVSDMFDYRLPITYDGAYSRIGDLEKA